MAATTNLDTHNPDGTLKKGAVINPTGKGGFGERPQDISPGGWKKENVISYQYKRFLNMTNDEIAAWAATPKSERTVAMEIAYQRVVAARKSLPDVKEITDRTEGKALQRTEVEVINPVDEILKKYGLGGDDAGENTKAQATTPESNP